MDLFVPLTGLKGPDSNGRDACEKNWLPFADGQDIKFIYDYDPFTIVTPNLKDGTVEPVLKIDIELDMSHFRGSSSPIAFDKGYLFVVHEVIFFEERRTDGTKWWKRHYIHRFLFLNSEMVPQKISLPFYFVSKDTEYCSGLAYDYSGKQLMLGCGINDCKAMMFGISEEKVKLMLRPFVIKS